jgi:gamma-glutamyltranspeptidase/glutathione hydrolase
MKRIFYASLLLSVTLSAQYADFNILKEVKVKNKGVVVSAHPLASEAGAKCLNRVEIPLML